MKCPECGSKTESKPPSLRPRELEALRLLAEDLDPIGVARKMFVTANTVHQYSLRIRRYFGVESNAAAVAKAQAWDVI